MAARNQSERDHSRETHVNSVGDRAASVHPNHLTTLRPQRSAFFDAAQHEPAYCHQRPQFAPAEASVSAAARDQ